jgi:hypothetical protein
MPKKIFVLGLMIILLCGCDIRRIHIERSVKEYETDYSNVSAEVIEFAGMNNREFEKSINEETEKSIESDLVAFDSEAADSSDKVRMGNKCVLDIKWDEKYNKNNFLSVVEEKYVYTGGAHGNTVRIPKNIDVAGEKTVKLSDLFENDGYTTTLNRMINEQLTEHSDEYRDLWAKPEIKNSHQTDFYIDGKNLVIFFQPYDLSYYARGFVEFPLPLDELSGYLKEEYRRLAV